MGGSGFIRRTSSKVVKFWVLDCWEIKAVEHISIRTEYICEVSGASVVIVVGVLGVPIGWNYMFVCLDSESFPGDL